MRQIALPLLLSAGLAFSAPANADNGLEDLVGGIAQSLLQSEFDKEAFAEAQSLNTVEAYRDYLKKFPNGLHRARAEAALAKMGAPVAGTAAADARAEADLRITRNQRILVQRELVAEGHLRGPADGVWGAKTRRAIAAWQEARKERVSGYLTDKQLPLLLEAAADQGAVLSDPVEAAAESTAARAEAQIGLTRAKRAEIQRHLAILGHDAGQQDGFWTSKTRAAIADWQRDNNRVVTGFVTPAQIRLIESQAAKAAPAAPITATHDAAMQERMLGLSAAERADLQRRLTRLGYGTRGADGSFGPNTRFAIRTWQEDHGVPVTGYLTAEALRLIYKQTM